MRSSLTAIGAVVEHRVDFASPLSETEAAVQMSAVFPDRRTAARAATVLLTWHEGCAQRARIDLKLKRVKVGDAAEVPTDVGTAVQWLSRYGPVAGDPDAAWFVAEGFAIDGDTMTYLVMRSAGQDYNYEPGNTPLEQGLRVAAQRLVESR